MKQTLEAFEASIATAKAQVTNMDRLPKITTCRSCNETKAELYVDDWQKIVKGITFKGKRYSYECSSCGECYSTNEMDNASLASLEKQK